MLGRLALSKKSVQVLRAAKGSVVGYAQRSGRRVVAGSRLAREAVPSAGSTGWCLVESPDDERPSGPRNEEGHGRWDAGLSRFSVMAWMAGLGAALCALRSPSGSSRRRESPRENLGYTAAGEDRLARAVDVAR